MTLEEIIDNPELIRSVSNQELSKLLSPYFPATRKPALPESKSTKSTHAENMMKEVLLQNADLIKKMREARK